MTDTLDPLCWLLSKTHALGADAADAIMFETVDISTSRRLRKPEGLERSESQAIGLRAFCGQQQAIVSSTDISRDALGELAERAVAMARATPPDPYSSLAPEDRHPHTISDLDLLDTQEPEAAWLDEQCALAEEAALSVTGITNSEGAEAHYSKSRISLAIGGATPSFAQSYASGYFSLSVSVLAGEGTDMQRDYDFSTARYRNDLQDAKALGLSASQRALARLHPKKVASCQVPVVFDPRVSRSLIGIISSATSGSAIARGSSFLKDSMGKLICSPGITITDDPHIKRGLGSKPFDGEGVRNDKLSLIKDGTLDHWLLDMRSAHKLGLATNGRASRGIASPPSPSSTNLYMEKGKQSPKALIGEIDNGFYVTETFGMGVNIITGDYSQGASGFWIENGEITYPVSEITIAGHLRDMLAHMTPANDLEFRYATNAPTVRLHNMTVAGT